MPASTASMCRRRESESVHSQRRVQASVREICSGMAVTLAQGSGGLEPPESPTPATLNDSRPRRPLQSGPKPVEKFVIEGGVPLSGTITPAGNKNGALPILAACLLTTDEVILRNVPRISDVEAMVMLLRTLGARVEWLAPSEVLVDSSTVQSAQVDRYLAERIRASFLLAGPLLARFGTARMPPPGGGVLGRRRA